MGLQGGAQVQLMEWLAGDKAWSLSYTYGTGWGAQQGLSSAGQLSQGDRKSGSSIGVRVTGTIQIRKTCGARVQ